MLLLLTFESWVNILGYFLSCNADGTLTSIFRLPLGKKAINYQVTTMLATSKNVLFPGPNHLLTTSADDPSL